MVKFLEDNNGFHIDCVTEKEAFLYITFNKRNKQILVGDFSYLAPSEFLKLKEVNGKLFLFFVNGKIEIDYISSSEENKDWIIKINNFMNGELK